MASRTETKEPYKPDWKQDENGWFYVHYGDRLLTSSPRLKPGDSTSRGVVFPGSMVLDSCCVTGWWRSGVSGLRRR